MSPKVRTSRNSSFDESNLDNNSPAHAASEGNNKRAGARRAITDNNNSQHGHLSTNDAIERSKIQRHNSRLQEERQSGMSESGRDIMWSTFR